METAIPGEYLLEVPARIKVIGIMAATPIPTKLKPISAGQKKGKMIIRPRPVKINEELITYIFFIPTVSISLSVKKRDKAIKTINTRYPRVKISAPTTSLK